MQEMEDFDFMDPVEVDDDLAADPAVDLGPDADAGERRAGSGPGAAGRYYEDSHEGFFEAWSKVVHAEDEEIFWRAWNLLKEEFGRQIGRFPTLFTVT